MWDFSNDKTGSEVIPNGSYPVIVDSFKQKTTKSGNDMLVLKFKITEGEYKGRVVFQNYMMSGNEKAVSIARGQLKTLLVAAGKPTAITGAHDFVGAEVSATIKVEVNEQYSDKNVISYVKKLTKSQPSGDVPF